MQSTGVGVQVATQMRGAVCCDIALRGGVEPDPLLDPEVPDCVEVLNDEPLEAEPDPADEGVVDFFGGVVLVVFEATGAFAAGFAAMCEVPFVTGCFAFDFDATFVGRAAALLAADFGEAAVLEEVPLEFERDTAAPPAVCVPLLTCVRVEDMSLPNGERTVRLAELDASDRDGPLCCATGLAANEVSAPIARPASTAASDAGSRIELKDDRINCSSTKVRTPHRNWTRPVPDRRSNLGTPTHLAIRFAQASATSKSCTAISRPDSHRSASRLKTAHLIELSLKSPPLAAERTSLWIIPVAVRRDTCFEAPQGLANHRPSRATLRASMANRAPSPWLFCWSSPFLHADIDFVMLPSVRALDQRWYPQFEANWDNRLFREMLLQRIDGTKRVLDYGCGRGHVEHMNFRGIAQFVAGTDPEEAVFENPYLDEARVLKLPEAVIPFDDESFDVVFADNVMEHVADPATTFREVWRVLKPGGVFLAKTPNKWHYMPLIARCTPTWFHKAVNRRRGRQEHDTFPTCYRCNSAGDVLTLARQTRFEVHRIIRVEGRPEYLRFNAATYACGRLYERIVNATNALERFRCVLMFEVGKPL